MLHVHDAQKRYVVITYNQIASDIIASTASTTILQCSQQGSHAWHCDSMTAD